MDTARYSAICTDFNDQKSNQNTYTSIQLFCADLCATPLSPVLTAAIAHLLFSFFLQQSGSGWTVLWMSVHPDVWLCTSGCQVSVTWDPTFSHLHCLWCRLLSLTLSPLFKSLQLLCFPKAPQISVNLFMELCCSECTLHACFCFFLLFHLYGDNWWSLDVGLAFAVYPSLLFHLPCVVWASVLIVQALYVDAGFSLWFLPAHALPAGLLLWLRLLGWWHFLSPCHCVLCFHIMLLVVYLFMWLSLYSAKESGMP